MSRQRIKNMICLVFHSIGIFSIYMVVMGSIHYKTFGGFFMDCLSFIVYLVFSLIFASTDDESRGSAKRIKKSAFFYPVLPKKIVHESGDYYIEYNKEDEFYDIYIDNYFNLKSLFRIEDGYINNSDDILIKVKEILDDKYRVQMKKIKRLQEKEDALKNWDGYTSIQEKRDDKIKQLTS